MVGLRPKNVLRRVASGSAPSRSRLAAARSTPSPSSHRPITANRADRRRREQLVVLAEGEIARSPRLGEGNALDLDRELHAGRSRDVPGVGGEPVRDVEHRVATRASRFPPRRGPAPAAARPSRNAAPAAPSGPVTTRTSPGLAPERPGTRSERPSAVTESTTPSGAGRVAAAHRDAALVQARVQLEHSSSSVSAGSRARRAARAARRRRRRGR